MRNADKLEINYLRFRVKMNWRKWSKMECDVIVVEADNEFVWLGYLSNCFYN